MFRLILYLDQDSRQNEIREDRWRNEMNDDIDRVIFIYLDKLDWLDNRACTRRII